MRQPIDDFSEVYEDQLSPFVADSLLPELSNSPAIGETEWTGEEETEWSAEEEAEWSGEDETEEEGWDSARESWEVYTEQEGVEPEFEEEVSLEGVADELSLAEELESENQVATGPTVRYPSGETLPIVRGAEASSRDEFWDPNQSKQRPNVPLVDTSGTQSRKRLSTSFTVAELARSGKARFNKARIDPALVKCLQAIRDQVRKPVTINSGYRSWAHNVRIYAPKPPKTSQHCSGRAVDIAIPGMSGLEIAKAAIDACGSGLGIGIDKHYAHIDIRGKWARWTYPGLGDVPTRRRAIQEIDAYRLRRAAAPRPASVPGPKTGPPAPVSSTGRFLKDVPRLQTAPMAPATPIAFDRKWPSSRRALAETYNRLGGLIGELATQLAIEPAAVLAVWRVESGGRAHTPGQAIIRFENHLLFGSWGRKNLGLYDQHFRHGGHGGQSGKAWENHQFRERPDQPFAPVHTGKQADEYRALKLGTRLAGENVGIQCISIGGPQILVLNYRRLGYASPRQMYDAFQASERAHVLGFFDFCQTTPAPKPGELIRYMRDRNWNQFAYYYNGKGQVSTYGGYLKAAYQEARAVPVPSRELEFASELEGDVLSEGDITALERHAEGQFWGEASASASGSPWV